MARSDPAFDIAGLVNNLVQSLIAHPAFRQPSPKNDFATPSWASIVKTDPIGNKAEELGSLVRKQKETISKLEQRNQQLTKRVAELEKSIKAQSAVSTSETKGKPTDAKRFVRFPSETDINRSCPPVVGDVENSALYVPDLTTKPVVHPPAKQVETEARRSCIDSWSPEFGASSSVAPPVRERTGLNSAYTRRTS